MKKILFSAILSLGLLFLAGSAVNAQTITGSIGPIKRGATTSGTIVVTIPKGLHVNSNKPNSQYAIPTTVKITSTGIKFGTINYPKGKNRKFQFSEDTLNVYEGTVSFSFSFSIPESFKGNLIKVRADVRYQACTDEVCYPPKTKVITLTARIK